MLSVLASAAFLLCSADLGLWGRFYYVRRRRRQMEEQVDEAREMLLELQALLKQPGWARLEKIAMAQLESRRNEVLLQPTTDTYAQEYMKGEIQGIQLFVNLPKRLVEENKEILEVAKRLEEEGA